MGKAGSVKYFMWGYQPHFRIGAGVVANGVFDLLDPYLQPDVFLVGIRAVDNPDILPICVEPDHCEFAPDFFKDVPSAAAALEKHFLARNEFHSHPLAHERYLHGLFLSSIRDAVLQVLISSATKDWRYYCATPVHVGNYWVCTVLRLCADAVASHHELPKRFKPNEMTSPRSLIEAAVSEIFELCCWELRTPDPGLDSQLSRRDAGELVRAAGRHLMYAASVAGNNFDGLHGLFDTCNKISSLRYEGSESQGGILIVPPDHPNIQEQVRFATPVSVRNHRGIRKLLELSTTKDSLLSDSASIYGAGSITGLYDPLKENLFSIRFTGHYRWELVHDSHILMMVQYGQPSFPSPKLSERRFKGDLARIFPKMTPEETNYLWEVTVAASGQKHGTMLVITKDAEQEAVRLASQCTRITPAKLDANTLLRMSSIDGAILLDAQGVCHAIGAILDGKASEKGDPGRGARFNSAIRYQWEKDGCMAVVISEDGTIDLVPDLMPQIDKSLITEAIEALRRNRDGQEFDRKSYIDAMTTVEKLHFYLLPEMCSEINALKALLDERHKKEEPDTARPIYPDFVADPEMNESYFLPQHN